MKEKILMIAVAASAGYAGGKLGAAPPENITAKSINADSIMVGKPGDPDGFVLVAPGMVNLTGPKGMSDPHVTLFYDGAAKDASLAVSGGGYNGTRIMGVAKGDKAELRVGLAEKNEISLFYEHGSTSTIERVLTGGRARKLVAD